MCRNHDDRQERRECVFFFFLLLFTWLFTTSLFFFFLVSILSRSDSPRATTPSSKSSFPRCFEYAPNNNAKNRSTGLLPCLPFLPENRAKSTNVFNNFDFDMITKHRHKFLIIFFFFHTAQTSGKMMLFGTLHFTRAKWCYSEHYSLLGQNDDMQFSIYFRQNSNN